VKKLRVDPVKLTEGYEDEGNPCYNCIIKGICSSACQGLWDYNEELTDIANKIARKWIPETVLGKNIVGRYKRNDFPLNDIIGFFTSVTDQKTVLGLLKNENSLSLIKNSQYYFNRQQFILKNYMNKHQSNANMGSMSSSSTSLASYSTANFSFLNPPKKQQHPVAKKVKITKLRRIYDYIKPPKKLNQHLVKRNV